MDIAIIRRRQNSTFNVHDIDVSSPNAGQGSSNNVIHPITGMPTVSIKNSSASPKHRVHQMGMGGLWNCLLYSCKSTNKSRTLSGGNYTRRKRRSISSHNALLRRDPVKFHAKAVLEHRAVEEKPQQPYPCEDGHYPVGTSIMDHDIEETELPLFRESDLCNPHLSNCPEQQLKGFSHVHLSHPQGDSSPWHRLEHNALPRRL